MDTLESCLRCHEATPEQNMKTVRILAHTLIYVGIVAFATSKASAEKYSATLNAPKHISAAETIALGIWAQAWFGYVSEKNGNATTPLNQYGASWADTVFQAGTYKWVNGKVTYPVHYKNNTVCGNFVTKCLETAYNWDWTKYKLNNVAVSVSPNSRGYRNLIEANVGLSKVSNIANVKMGDLMVIDYLGNAANTDNSGHTMIVRNNLGFFESKADAVDKNVYRIWTLEVLDSTSQPHDTDYDGTDTRLLTTKYGVTVSSTGAGCGKVMVITDKTNNILGYCWKFATSVMSKSYKTTMDDYDQNQANKPITFGKLLLPAK